MQALYKPIVGGDDFVIDSLDGVPAYPSRQCNELAVRYYDEICDVDIFVGVYSPFLYENFPLLGSEPIEDYGDIPDSVSGFTHAAEPKKGDIVYWSMARRGKSYAHTALVKSYANGVITLIEQNWNWNGQAVFERKIKWPSQNYVVYTLDDKYKNRSYAEDSRVTVEIDGVSTVNLSAYALRDTNGYPTNYVKLRDVAHILNGRAAQFNVDWRDGEIKVDTRTAYTTPNGTEMQSVFYGRQPYARNANRLVVDGEQASLDAITLTDINHGQHTYFKLRDLGAALGFNVSWDGQRELILIDTTSPYDPSN